MTSRVRNFEIGIDSSLSYCSITLFKNEKIIWDKTVKSEYGHEKILSKLLQNLVSQKNIKANDIKKLHLNNGPARFTAIRNCHSLMKGFFINHKVEIMSYSIFEHFFLGIKKKPIKNILCVIDTNRKDLALQQIDMSGKLIGNTKTLKIDSDLVDVLGQDYLLIGNGLEKLKKISEFNFIKNKTILPIKLKSNYFVNKHYRKKSSYKFPKIIYPYSPV